MKLKISFSAHSIHFPRAPAATEVLHMVSNKQFPRKIFEPTQIELIAIVTFLGLSNYSGSSFFFLTLISTGMCQEFKVQLETREVVISSRHFSLSVSIPPV